MQTANITIARRFFEFEQQDIRTQMPNDPFHLVLYRNLVFTYFDQTLQQAVLQRMFERVLPGGVLVVGSHESLPPGSSQIQAVNDAKRIYRNGNS